MKRIDPLECLRRFVGAYPSQRAAADELGISRQYLTQILNSKRAFSDEILDRLELERVVVQKGRS